jgi:hypothetical protein
MKTFAITAVFVLLLAVVAVRKGVVNIHYARMIDNQALSNPIRVESVDGTRIRLSDGRTIQLDEAAFDAYSRGQFVAGRMIEMIGNCAATDYFILLGNVPQTICGGTSAFRIPLIPRDVDRNVRGVIGVGSFYEDSKEADQAEVPSDSLPSS